MGHTGRLRSLSTHLPKMNPVNEEHRLTAKMKLTREIKFTLLIFLQLFKSWCAFCLLLLPLAGDKLSFVKHE